MRRTINMKTARPSKLEASMAGAAFVFTVAFAVLIGGAQAQQGPRFGLAPAVAAPVPAMVPIERTVSIVRTVSIARTAPVVRPLVLIRSQSIYYPSHSGNSYSGIQYSGNTHSGNPYYAQGISPPAQAPYLVGPGQWVPEGTQVEMLSMQSDPGVTRATPASASAHWDWQRTSPGDLVEMSRRNKASRAAN